MSAASAWEIATKASLGRLSTTRSLAEGLTLVTRDPVFRRYGVKVLKG